MNPVSLHLDPVTGVDVHMILTATTPPVPLPIPHPFVGFVFDPIDYIPFIGATVFVRGIPRTQAGTEVKSAAPHFPIGGSFIPPIPMNSGEVFMGSSLGTMDGDAGTYSGLPVLTCQSIGIPPPFRLKKKSKNIGFYLPTSMVMAIPSGMTLPGPPTISASGLIGGAIGLGLGKALKKFKKTKIAQKSADYLHGKVEKLLVKNKRVGTKVKNFAHKSICTLTGHPIDVATGKLLTDEVDFSLPGLIPFEWERTWYSCSGHNGALGHGWHHKYDTRLEIEDGLIIFRMEDGRYCGFPTLTVGESHYNEREHLTLRRIGEFEYEIVFPNFLTHTYKKHHSNEYLLSRIFDHHKNQLTFHYQSENLAKVVDTTGREIFFDYEENSRRIAKIWLEDPNVPGVAFYLVKYGYDQHGNLTRVRNQRNLPYYYEYENHLLVKETDRNGFSFYFEYDHIAQGLDARCIKTWGDEGHIFRELKFNLPCRETTVTDSRGAETTYNWGNLGLVHRKVDALGRVESTEWTDDLQKSKETLIDGEVITYGYDNNSGKMLERASNRFGKISYHYNEFGHPDVTIDELGNKWTQICDANGMPVQKIGPDGQEELFEYDQKGRLVSEKNGKGDARTYQWDDNSNLVRISDRLGRATHFKYDRLGRLVERSNPLGETEKFVWNGTNQLVKFIGADQGIKHYTYDSMDNLTSTRDETNRETRFTYGPMGVLTSMQTPDGQVASKEYDKELDLIKVINNKKQPWVYQRDNLGRVYSEKYFDGRTVSFQFDECDHVIRQQDHENRSTIFERNHKGLLTKVNYYDGITEEFTYDEFARLTVAKNKHTQLDFAYDRFGRVVEETQNEATIHSIFDQEGMRTGVINSLGRELSFAYTNEGELLEIKQNQQSVLSFGLDALGRREHIDYGHGLHETRSYTARSYLKQSILRRHSDSIIRSREYEWNSTGELKEIKDSIGGKWQYGHDLAGRLSQVIYPDQRIEKFIRDEAGHMPGVPQDQFYKNKLSGLTHAGDYELLWNSEGQLISKRGKDWNIEFQFDACKRLVSVWKQPINARRERELFPSEAGELAPDEELIHYKYDPLGRRTKKIIHKTNRSQETTFIWDRNVLSEEITKHSSAYEKDRTIEYIHQPGGFELLAQIEEEQVYLVQSDHIGTPISAYKEGVEVWSGSFEAYGKLVCESGQKGLIRHRFQGQYHDEETGLNYNRFRYYDSELKVYTQCDPIGISGGMELWNYVDDPTGWVDPFGLSKSCVHTEKDTAFFWSGRTNGVGGDKVAAEVARSKGGTTLELILEKRKIKIPDWDPNDEVSVIAWKNISEEYANNAYGNVRVVLGEDLRTGNVWEAREYGTLLKNQEVTEIIKIDPLTNLETTIFTR